MSAQYIKYLPKVKSTSNLTEEFKNSEQFKKLEELQPYISVDPDKFHVAENVQPKKKNERKLNVRVKQHDLYLLDAIAKHDGISRSALINKILYHHFLNELMEIEDRDARALLANTVDQQMDYDNLDRPWVYDALEHEFKYVLQNIMEFNDTYEQQRFDKEQTFNSDIYIGLSKKLEGLEK
jgi:predicted HicB family RNase H-like nuclease